MLLFCPNCGRRFEVPGHLEADAAHKCPSCGVEFGGARREATSGGRLKFVSGGETHYETASSRAPGDARVSVGEAARAGQVRRVDPAKCELGRELSRSGAGVLFEGKDTQSGEPVLVRRLLVEGGSVADAERWSAAAAKLQNLRHPRVVPVLGVGLRDGVPHVVAERAAGRDLGSVVAGRPITVRQAMQYALHVVEALTAAQGAGAVHGNLKPSNVIIDPQGRARVCDFGLAPRALEAGELIPGPHVLGWLPFAPPEMVREGPALADERSDAYGLGALVYFMLTGRPPFAADDPRALLTAALEETPRPPSSLNPKVPAELDSTVMRALEKNAALRTANVQALGYELRRFERELPVKAARAAGTPVRKRSWLGALFVIVLLGAAAGGGYWYYERTRVEAALEAARVLVNEARELERAPGGLPEAVDRYRRAAEAVAGHPAEAEHLLLLADSLVRSGDLVSAAETLERASRLRAPEALDARARLPAALLLAGRAEEAESAWRALAASNVPPAVASRSAESAIEAAEFLARSGRPEEARRALESLLQMDSYVRAVGVGAEGELRESYGRVLFALDRFDDARTQFNRALSGGEAGRPAARERAALGLVAIVDSDIRRKELSEEEERAIAFSALARALYARALLARALDSGPKTEATQALLSRASGAASAVALSTDSPPLAKAWARLALGEASEAAGRLDEARAHFEAAVASASGERADPARASSDSRYPNSGPAGSPAAVESLALAGAARLALRAGDARKAIADLREVSRRIGGDATCSEAAATALLLEGHAQRLLGQSDEAARRYRELVGTFGGGKSPRGVRAAAAAGLCGLGEVAMETRAAELAVSNFERLRTEAPTGLLGLIARVMTGGATEGELVEAAARATPDEAARAFYCAALRRDLANEPGPAHELFNKAIEVAGEVSWYRFLARARLERQ